MAVADFYDSLQRTRGAPFIPFNQLTSAEQAHFEDAYGDTIEGNTHSIDDLFNRITIQKAASVQVSNAAMLTLRASPVEVVPAVEDNIILPIAIVTSVPQVTTARAGAYDVRLRWQIAATTFESCTGDINRSTIHGATANARTAFNYATLAGHARALSTFVNKPLVVHNEDSAEYTGGHVNNVVTFFVTYYLIEV